MRLDQLIAKAGDRLKTQMLAESVVSVRQKKHDAEITFATEKACASELARVISLGGKPSCVGIVVWIPADVFEEKGGAK